MDIKYFATSADVRAGAAGESILSPMSGNSVTPLIDGRNYFREIRSLLSRLGSGPNVSKQFFYMVGWWLHLAAGPGTVTTAKLPPGGGVPLSPTTRVGDSMPPFSLEGDLMTLLLANKAAKGVDVRVMGWVNPLLLLNRVASEQEGYWNVTVGTVRSIDALRSQLAANGSKPLAKRVCALTIGHMVGAMHLKMVVAHDGTKPMAFVGGIDVVPDRIAGEMHPGSPNTEWWHDMAVMVDGPAVQQVYDLYRNLWNEQIARPHPEQFMVSGKIIKSVEPATEPIPSLTFPSTGTGKHRVQVVRTLPQYNFSTLKPSDGGTSLSFAPSGAFEIVVAWRKAIANATKYIYIEDQAFYSQDVMDWINQRVRNSAIKVILLKGGLTDPTDIVNDGPLVEAVNNHLLAGLGDPEKDRIGLFVRKNLYIHSKVTIIDDQWLLVGSANCMRRSLYTDGEISVATLDEKDRLAKTLRVDLWGAHFGKDAGSQRTSLKNLDRALAVWRPSWGSSPPYPLPTTLVKQMTLPLPAASVPFDPVNYKLLDTDSRETF